MSHRIQLKLFEQQNSTEIIPAKEFKWNFSRTFPWVNFPIFQMTFWVRGHILTLTGAHLKEFVTTFHPSVFNFLCFDFFSPPGPLPQSLNLNFTFFTLVELVGWCQCSSVAPSTPQELSPLELLLLRPQGTRRLNAWTSWSHYGPTPLSRDSAQNIEIWSLDNFSLRFDGCVSLTLGNRPNLSIRHPPSPGPLHPFTIIIVLNHIKDQLTLYTVPEEKPSHGNWPLSGYLTHGILSKS